jgi:hypothetical protein
VVPDLRGQSGSVVGGEQLGPRAKVAEVRKGLDLKFVYAADPVLQVFVARGDVQIIGDQARTEREMRDEDIRLILHNVLSNVTDSSNPILCVPRRTFARGLRCAKRKGLAGP